MPLWDSSNVKRGACGGMLHCYSADGWAWVGTVSCVILNNDNRHKPDNHFPVEELLTIDLPQFEHIYGQCHGVSPGRRNIFILYIYLYLSIYMLYICSLSPLIYLSIIWRWWIWGQKMGGWVGFGAWGHYVWPTGKQWKPVSYFHIYVYAYSILFGNLGKEKFGHLHLGGGHGCFLYPSSSCIFLLPSFLLPYSFPLPSPSP